MTGIDSDQAAPPADPQRPPGRVPRPDRLRPVQPVLDRLFELYPHLFGANFLPLKLGVFQELLLLHPGDFEREALKAALGVHTRSTRYLQSVAAGNQRHDLQGTAVEPVAPEHVCAAMLELFRRRQARTQEDLRPKLHRQLIAAFLASGLTRQDYLSRVLTRDAAATTLVEQAFEEYDQQLARQEALRTAFASSGKTPQEFADMYGLDQRTVNSALQPALSRIVDSTTKRVTRGGSVPM